MEVVETHHNFEFMQMWVQQKQSFQLYVYVLRISPISLGFGCAYNYRLA